jgi:hypothetical protein
MPVIKIIGMANPTIPFTIPAITAVAAIKRSKSAVYRLKVWVIGPA